MLFTVTSTRGFYTPLRFFFDLRFLQATAESWRGLCFVYIISLFTFESSIDISLITIYLYKKIHIFPYKQQLEMHRKEANLTENHTTLKWFQFPKSIQNNQLMKKTQVCKLIIIAFLRKTNTKVETSSLRT